jgi:hypothetical protein
VIPETVTFCTISEFSDRRFGRLVTGLEWKTGDAARAGLGWVSGGLRWSRRLYGSTMLGICQEQIFWIPGIWGRAVGQAEEPEYGPAGDPRGIHGGGLCASPARWHRLEWSIRFGWKAGLERILMAANLRSPLRRRGTTSQVPVSFLRHLARQRPAVRSAGGD